MVKTNSPEDWLPLKQSGNELFKNNEFEKAIESYTAALNLQPPKEDERVIYRNRAACYLKLEKYQDAYNDADTVLNQDASDVKALFRRFVIL